MGLNTRRVQSFTARNSWMSFPTFPPVVKKEEGGGAGGEVEGVDGRAGGADEEEEGGAGRGRLDL